MKSYIALAAVLVLVTGCTVNDNAIQKQSVPKHVNMDHPAHAKAPASTVTQSSSTATAGARKPSMSMKQAPNTLPDWLIGQPGTTENPADKNQSTSQFEQQVLSLVNAQRTNAGLSTLSMDENLSKVAMVKAKDMYDNNYFDHTSPTYGSPFDMMRNFQIPFNAAGENIAKGQPTPEQVMNDWMNSEGHRANIMNSGFTKIGIAYYNGTWVQEFTG
ncbi:CAP domain-containing protein [Paenibacillus abyssi]